MPTITYNIPAEAQVDLLNAMRKKFNKPNATTNEIIALIDQEFKLNLRRIYRDYMREKEYDVSLD